MIPRPDFLDLHHRGHTVPAEDINFFRGPHALAAAGTNQLAGTAGPFPSRRGPRPALSRPNRPGMEERGKAAPTDPYLIPPL